MLYTQTYTQKLSGKWLELDINENVISSPVSLGFVTYTVTGFAIDPVAKTSKMTIAVIDGDSCKLYLQV